MSGVDMLDRSISLSGEPLGSMAVRLLRSASLSVVSKADKLRLEEGWRATESRRHDLQPTAAVRNKVTLSREQRHEVFVK